ncbi:MAG: cysteine desulfurase [Spirochaetaceae bacterium]
MSSSHSTGVVEQGSAPLDTTRIRDDFPILSRTMRGKPFVYLDNSATSLKPQSVIDAEVAYYTEMGANIHRGVYEFSERASMLYDEARERTARFINAPPESHVIFTRGTTEAVNTVAYGWGLKHLGPGDEVVISEIEHHANFVPWQAICDRTGAVLKFIPADPADGRLRLDELEGIVSAKTRLVAITAMSNVTGYMPPLEPIIARAKEVGAVTLVDGAQLVSHQRVDVTALGADFLAFSGHKMLGPTGVGVLWGKAEVLEDMDPFLLGGDMIVKVRKERTTFKDLPERFEAGTPNIAGVIGFSAALEYLESVGMDAIHRHEQELLSHAVQRAAAYEDITVYGPADVSTRGGVFSFNIADVHPHDTGAILDQEGIAVRTGLHCAHPLMQVFGVPGTTRASFYLYNTVAEIDRLFEGIDRVRNLFG